MQMLEAVYKIVTPMFLSGADQEATELRPPTIKGVIRFWWRALAYSRFNCNLDELAKRENELFGSTEQTARIIIRVLSPLKISATQKGIIHQNFKTLAGARYLGYGLMDAFDGTNTEAGKLQRPCINHNQQINVIFISKCEIPEEFINAVKLTGLLGGLGSRSRKGFGSLTLDKLTLNKKSIWTKPVKNNDYREILGIFLNGMSNITEEPSFSAFSDLTRIDYLLNGNDPIKLLDEFGQQMQRYRSWGHHGRVNGADSEQNFKPDHDWYKTPGDRRNNSFHPQRVIFGLPHNYSKFEADNVTGAEHDRRSSPLLVHVQEYAPNSYSLISTVLRSKFLPDDEKVQAGNRQVTQQIEWELIDNFLDGYVGHRDNKTALRYFPNKKTWFGS